MKVPMMDLKLQHDKMRDEINAAISDVIDSSGFILGEKVKKFEEEFAGFCASKHAVAMSSGTSALHAALAALGVGQGDEVITVPFTFAATVEAICLANATPVFIDIEPKSFTMDVSQLEGALTEKTRALLPVHLYGQTAKMDAIMEFARQHNLFVIEDSAQAQGATYNGKHAGTFGDIGTFSFYPGKNIGAIGDAGACITDSDELAENLRLVVNHGQPTKYIHQTIGYNYRCDSIQAAVLSIKLKRLDSWNEARRNHAARYLDKLKGTGLKLPEVLPDRVTVWHQFVIRTPDREALRNALNDAGIATAMHYPMSLHLQPSFRFLGYSEGDFPVSEACADEVLSLPIYPEMEAEALDYVIQNVREACLEAVV